MDGMVFNIQGYSIHDGPGIRTTVFIKGCMLACQWCANPESISRRPELGFFKSLCTKCGKCAGVCPEEAIVFDTDGLPSIERQRCTGCGMCVSICDAGALVVYGKQMSVQEIFDAVSRDDMFYQASNGGITASGGEPLVQPEFVCALFEQCREVHIHTCLDTSGYASSRVLREVLLSTDLVLFDLKHLNSSIHRQFTGKPNRLVLTNAKLAVESGVEVVFRMPLIPGINDGLQNIQETAAFLKGLGSSAHRLDLLPYHRMGVGKYESLGRPYPLAGLLPPEPADVESVRQAFEESGIQCTVSK